MGGSASKIKSKGFNSYQDWIEHTVSDPVETLSDLLIVTAKSRGSELPDLGEPEANTDSLFRMEDQRKFSGPEGNVTESISPSIWSLLDVELKPAGEERTQQLKKLKEQLLNDANRFVHYLHNDETQYRYGSEGKILAWSSTDEVAAAEEHKVRQADYRRQELTQLIGLCDLALGYNIDATIAAKIAGNTAQASEEGLPLPDAHPLKGLETFLQKFVERYQTRRTTPAFYRPSAEHNALHEASALLTLLRGEYRGVSADHNGFITEATKAVGRLHSEANYYDSNRSIYAKTSPPLLLATGVTSYLLAHALKVGASGLLLGGIIGGVAFMGLMAGFMLAKYIQYRMTESPDKLAKDIEDHTPSMRNE